MAIFQLADVKGGGGGSPYRQPQLPEAVADGVIYRQGNLIPHGGTLIDSVDVPPNNTFPFNGVLDAVAIWSVTKTDINASATDWLFGNGTPWYDDVNGRLYIFALDIVAAPDRLYTAWIDLETGAVTNVGDADLSGGSPSGVTSYGAATITRDSIDSGNFTFKTSDRTFVINSTDGSEVSNVAEANIIGDETVYPAYTTLDGSAGMRYIQETGSVGNRAYVMRNKNLVRAPWLVNTIGSESILVYPIPWGSKVKLWANSASDDSFLRTFDRTEFDTWIHAMCDFGGIE